MLADIFQVLLLYAERVCESRRAYFERIVFLFAVEALFDSLAYAAALVYCDAIHVVNVYGNIVGYTYSNIHNKLCFRKKPFA